MITQHKNIAGLGSKGMIRQFETGATRDTEEGKYDYEGFLHPLVIERFGAYMHKHRKQSDGNLRDSDNWQKGMPMSVYIKSLWRHFLDLWLILRGHPEKARETLEDACCAIIFNVQGILLNRLKDPSNHGHWADQVNAREGLQL